MKKNCFFYFAFLFFSAFSCLWAQEPVEEELEKKEKTPKVFELFNSKGRESSVTFFQDPRIEQIFLDKHEHNAQEKTRGYRVQVFSSNRQAKAKGEAYRIEALVQEKFSNENIYVTYTSPFWKVRVGDFQTEEEAREMQEILKRAFPNMKKEIYIVGDEIILSQIK